MTDNDSDEEDDLEISESYVVAALIH